MAGKIIVFGAGATGRGHVGLLAWQAGYEIVFVDNKPELVALLRKEGRYRVRLLGGQEAQDVEVSGFRVWDAANREAVARELVDAALVLTSVFDRNLPDVAQTIALGVAECRRAGRVRPLNVLACENMMDSSSTLGRHVHSRLDQAEAPYHAAIFGYPDCMISRVVPQPEPDPLFIITEDYNEWTARSSAFLGPKPPGLDALDLVDNQDARLERKLFIHNGGHAICGYFGYLRGHRYIHEAVGDSVVAQHVAGALDEIGEVVRRKHAFSAESIDAYKQDLVRRGSIAEMRDEIVRIVRDPIRKLSPRERLLGPALLAVDYGLPRRWLALGIAAALRCDNPADPIAVDLQSRIRNRGLTAVLQDVCGLAPESILAGEICAAWAQVSAM